MDLVSTYWAASRTAFGVLSLCPAEVGNRFSCMFGYLSFELLDLDAV